MGTTLGLLILQQPLARKYIPVPISEVTLDWSIIPREEIKVEETDEDEEKVSSNKRFKEKSK